MLSNIVEDYHRFVNNWLEKMAILRRDLSSNGEKTSRHEW